MLCESFMDVSIWFSYEPKSKQSPTAVRNVFSDHFLGYKELHFELICDVTC